VVVKRELRVVVVSHGLQDDVLLQLCLLVVVRRVDTNLLEDGVALPCPVRYFLPNRFEEPAALGTRRQDGLLATQLYSVRE
jgi:hypothetical protein